MYYVVEILKSSCVMESVWSIIDVELNFFKSSMCNWVSMISNRYGAEMIKSSRVTVCRSWWFAQQRSAVCRWLVKWHRTTCSSPQLMRTSWRASAVRCAPHWWQLKTSRPCGITWTSSTASPPITVSLWITHIQDILMENPDPDFDGTWRLF